MPGEPGVRGVLDWHALPHVPMHPAPSPPPPPPHVLSRMLQQRDVGRDAERDLGRALPRHNEVGLCLVSPPRCTTPSTARPCVPPTYLRMCACTYMCMHSRTRACARAHTMSCAHARTRTHTHTHTHTHIPAHTTSLYGADERTSLSTLGHSQGESRDIHWCQRVCAHSVRDDPRVVF